MYLVLCCWPSKLGWIKHSGSECVILGLEFSTTKIPLVGGRSALLLQSPHFVFSISTSKHRLRLLQANLWWISSPGLETTATKVLNPVNVLGIIPCCNHSKTSWGQSIKIKNNLWPFYLYFTQFKNSILTKSLLNIYSIYELLSPTLLIKWIPYSL